jgi:creatinine amidohydrolase
MQESEMRFEDLNWMDIEAYLKTDDRLILVVGSCEQHGHLSLGTDVRIPSAIADAISERSGVPVAPALNFGISPYFADYPGTISLRTDVFLHVIADIVRSVHRHGFRGLLWLNGHGGNAPASAALYELANELPDLRISWHSWWTVPQVTDVEKKHSLTGTHADWSEAFAFTRVGPLPEGENPPVEWPYIIDAERVRELLGDGMFGGKYQVDDSIMDELFNAAVEGAMQELQKLKLQDKPKK